jgi:hypothetical protein
MGNLPLLCRLWLRGIRPQDVCGIEELLVEAPLEGFETAAFPGGEVVWQGEQPERGEGAPEALQTSLQLGGARG